MRIISRRGKVLQLLNENKSIFFSVVELQKKILESDDSDLISEATIRSALKEFFLVGLPMEKKKFITSCPRHYIHKFRIKKS